MRFLVFAGLLVGCAPHHDLPARADTGTPAQELTSEPVAYPDGPYGGIAGSVIPDLAFEGYPQHSTTWSSVALHELYDPDGSKGVKVILLISSVAWCPTCQAMAKEDFPTVFAKYDGLGVRFVHVQRERATPGQPATRESLEDWRGRYHFTFDDLLDPDERTFALEGANEGTPWIAYIDPRTMVVRNVVSNYGSLKRPIIDAILKKNGGVPPPP
ncbi:MAG: TlpA family protein disulfide reductase [Polyangiales bacterium]